MISLEADRVGTIVHTNDEIYRILGYVRNSLIGRKINSIQPKPIAEVHDLILRKFLDTAKRNVINHTLQLYGITAEGYMKPILLIAKLYPQLSNKITIVGFIQNLTRIDGFDLTKLREGDFSESQIEKFIHHYIITDTSGTISCISEGLAQEVGLHSKFFTSNQN